MHHELLIRKLIRKRAYPDQRSRPIDEGVVRQLAHSTATAVIDDLLPKSVLDKIRIEEILHFREQTRTLRQQAITEIGNRLSVLSRIPDVEDLLVASREVQQSIRSDLRTYRAEVAATRDRLWPTLVTALSANLAGGSVAAVAMSYIGGPGYALAASVVAASLGLLKGALDLQAERRKAEASRSPAITYLARVTGLHGR
jgi:hypothetical protein